MYKALRQLTVGDVVKQPGDDIPEAMEWTNVQSWLRNGFIEEVPDPEPPKPKAAPRRAPAKKAPAKKPSTKKTKE